MLGVSALPGRDGGSIHIHGTNSSIVDTVFVCRTSGAAPESWLVDTPERLIAIIGKDLADLANTSRTPTHGDTRCIVLSHLTRMANWSLRDDWEPARPTAEKIAAFCEQMTSYGDPADLARQVPAAESLAGMW